MSEAQIQIETLLVANLRATGRDLFASRATRYVSHVFNQGMTMGKLDANNRRPASTIEHTLSVVAQCFIDMANQYQNHTPTIELWPALAVFALSGCAPTLSGVSLYFSQVDLAAREICPRIAAVRAGLKPDNPEHQGVLSNDSGPELVMFSSPTCSCPVRCISEVCAAAPSRSLPLKGFDRADPATYRCPNPAAARAQLSTRQDTNLDVFEITGPGVFAGRGSCVYRTTQAAPPKPIIMLVR